MAGAAPTQPLPPWMSTTYLPAQGGSGNRLVTVVFPQTYSGPSLPGLTWPWVTPNANNPDGGTLVSILGQQADGSGQSLTRLGGTRIAGQVTRASAATRPSIPSTSQTPIASTSRQDSTSVQPSPSPAVASRPSASAASAATSPSTRRTATISGSSAVRPTSRPSSSSSASASTSRRPSSIISSPPSSAFSSSVVDPPTHSSLPTVHNQSRRLSGGAIAGIVLGVAGLLLLLLLLLVLLRWRRRRQQAGYSRGNAHDPEAPHNGGEQQNAEMASRGGAAFLSVGAVRASSNSPESQSLMSGYVRYARHTPFSEDGNVEALATAEEDGLNTTSSSSRIRNASAATGSSNPSNSTGGSTTTRGSLIAQFPTYRRRSDESGPPSAGGRGGGNGNGKKDGKDGDRRGDGSPATMASSDLFSAPPPRPPSRTRTVTAGSLPSQAAAAMRLGKGMPPSQKQLPRIPAPQVDNSQPDEALDNTRRSAIPIVVDRRNVSSSREPGFIVSSNEDYQQHLENYHSSQSDASQGVGGWLGGFGFLRPYLGGNTSLPRVSSQNCRIAPTVPEKADDGSPEGAERGGPLPLPSSTPLDRNAPSYRRVTTTAAAYSPADLEDLQRKPSETAQPGSSGETGKAAVPSSTEGNSDDEGEADESQSFLDQGANGAVALGQKAHVKSTSRRWSRNTLGRPIRHLSGISGISQVSLADARSISESIAGSVMAARSRSRSISKTRSRSNSNSAHSRSDGSHSLSLSRANSLAAASHSSRSDGGSHGSRKSTLNSNSSKGKRARRQDNSSGSANGSSQSHASAESELSTARSRLRKVSEWSNEGSAPPIPKRLPLPGQT